MIKKEFERIIRVEKPLWGWEEIIVNDKDYCLKRLNLWEMHWFSLQYHKNKKEYHYVERGVILMQKGINGKALSDNDLIEYKILTEGDIITIPQFTAHRCGSLEGTSTILEVSTHHEDSDSYRDEVSGKIDLDKLELPE